MQRRTRALAELVAAALGLLVQVSVWKWAWDNEDDWDEPVQVSMSGLVAGVLYRGVHCWIRDRDVGGVGTSPYRRLLFGVCSRRLVKRRLPRTREFRSTFSVGELVGTVGYRCWYGLLRPLPGTDE